MHLESPVSVVRNFTEILGLPSFCLVSINDSFLTNNRFNRVLCVAHRGASPESVFYDPGSFLNRVNITKETDVGPEVNFTLLVSVLTSSTIFPLKAQQFSAHSCLHIWKFILPKVI